MRYAWGGILVAAIVGIAATAALGLAYGAHGNQLDSAGAFVPTVSRTSSTIGIGASKDNTLYQSASGNISNGAGQFFFVGRTNGGSLRRGVVAFDIASSVPAGSTITSVSLTLHMSWTGVGFRSVDLHRLLADWGEGSSNAGGGPFGGGGGGASATTNDATWVHRFFNTTQWSSNGGDFSNTVSASVSVGGAGTYTWGSTAQMVADVQAWLDDPSASFGWLLKGNEGTRSAKRFDTKENGTPSNRPVLTVGFTPPSRPPPAPTLLAPTSGDFINDSTPLFDWDASTGGDVVSYRLQVTSSDDFSGSLNIDVLLTGDLPAGPVTQFQTNEPLLDAAYRWRVIAGDSVPNTAASATRAFVVDTIAPNAPTRLARETTGGNSTLRFTWDRSVDPVPPTGTTGDQSDPNFYTVFITRTTGNQVVDSDTVPDPGIGDVGFIPNIALETRQYRIDVTPADRADNTGATASLVFAVGQLDTVLNLRALGFVFTADGRGAVFNADTPKFRWTRPSNLPLDGFLTYEVAITGDVFTGAISTAPFTILAFSSFIGGRFTVECFDVNDLPAGADAVCLTALAPGDQIQITVKAGLLPDGVHRLFVRTVASGDVKGPAVAADFTVDTGPPGKPTLLAPPDGFVGNDATPTFAWRQVTGDVSAITYAIEVARGTADFTDLAFTADGIADNPVSSSGLAVIRLTLPGSAALSVGDYIWRVRSTDAAGNTADFSDPFTFRVTLAGDANRNGVVDFFDLLLVILNLVMPSDARADVNRDRVINILDLVTVAIYFRR